MKLVDFGSSLTDLIASIQASIITTFLRVPYYNKHSINYPQHPGRYLLEAKSGLCFWNVPQVEGKAKFPVSNVGT